MFDLPRERDLAWPERPSSIGLLRRRDFRILFSAAATSELGDSLSYIALMWLALDRGGALGVVAVRLADSLPAFFFGLHGGIAADRWSRRRLMVGAISFAARRSSRSHSQGSRGRCRSGA